MGKLFVRIFLAFWLVCCAVLASWMLAASYFDEQPLLSSSSETHSRAPPQRFMLRSLYELQNLELERLPARLEALQKRHGVEILILDRQGQELFGQDVPPVASELAQRLDGPRRRVAKKLPEGRIFAHEIYRSDLGQLRAVYIFKPPQGALQLLGGNLWLRISLAALVSGLICYWLSRVVTARLKTLQVASRRLASGELDTRLDVRDQGGDETDELARDFNSMAEQLQERIQAQKRLLGDVSHELRTPLARLRIALALAQQDSSNRQAHFDRLETEAERLEELIAQLLTTESVANQIGEELDSHIDLISLLAQLCSDANFEGAPEGKSVSLTNSHDQLLVMSRSDLLRKCFENLLRNALTHTATGTTVKVRVDVTQGYAQVRIEDQGPGVPEQELERIFDAFYRVDTARTRESGGYGLGLSMARRIALQHRGSVAASNTGHGLSVTVRLPLSE